VCQNNLEPCKGYGRSDYYTCNAGIHMPKGSAKRHTVTIQAVYAERFMVEHVRGLLCAPGEAEAAIARLASQDEIYNTELAVAESKLAEVERKLAKQKKLEAPLEDDEMDELSLLRRSGSYEPNATIGRDGQPASNCRAHMSSISLPAFIG
jgi:hypothetical protein